MVLVTFGASASICLSFGPNPSKPYQSIYNTMEQTRNFIRGEGFMEC